MSRPRATQPMSIPDIKAELAALIEQRALLAADLNDAVLADEKTTPYRDSIAATDKVVADLERKLADAEHAEEERRRGIVEATAREICQESHRRHDAMMEALLPPPNPAELKEFAQ